MTPRRGHADSDDLDKLVAGQRRRHLVAQFMTARRWAQHLEDALLRGTSPTGYGARLAPLAPRMVECVLEPVAELIERFRRFVAEQAPEELAQAEAGRAEAHTVLWARNLLEQLADTVEELAREVGARAETEPLGESAQRLAEEVRPLVGRARRALTTWEDG